MRTLGKPSSPPVASAIALGSLVSDASASCIQVLNRAKGSSRGTMPPSSSGPPISIVMCPRPSSLTPDRVALASHAQNQQDFSDSGVAAYDAGNYQQAFKIWWDLRYEDLAAMRNLAMMLRKGQGVAKDP